MRRPPKCASSARGVRLPRSHAPRSCRTLWRARSRRLTGRCRRAAHTGYAVCVHEGMQQLHGHPVYRIYWDASKRTLTLQWSVVQQARDSRWVLRLRSAAWRAPVHGRVQSARSTLLQPEPAATCCAERARMHMGCDVTPYTMSAPGLGLIAAVKLRRPPSACAHTTHASARAQL